MRSLRCLKILERILGKKLWLNQLVFEVTRRCNMFCDHCLRDEAENIDMAKEIIDKTLANVRGIKNLTFTGGEPTLAVELIRYIYEVCVRNNITVNHVWCATNGKEMSLDFLDVMTKFIEYTTEYYDGDEYYGVALSTDQFHEMLDEENYDFYRNYEYYDDCKDNLSKGKKLNYTIPEGRADINYLPTNDYNHILTDCSFDGSISEELNEVDIEDGMIYVNALGEILLNCDYSFYTQEEKTQGNILKEDNLIYQVIARHASEDSFEEVDEEEGELAYV